MHPDFIHVNNVQANLGIHENTIEHNQKKRIVPYNRFQKYPGPHKNVFLLISIYDWTRY